MDLLEQLLPGAAEVIEATYEEVAPGMTDLIVDYAFGMVAARPGLAMRDRVIANIAALTTIGGAEPQLLTQVAVAEQLGLSRAQITEVILNTSPIAGLARAQAALLALPPVSVDRSRE